MLFTTSESKISLAVSLGATARTEGFVYLCVCIQVKILQILEDFWTNTRHLQVGCIQWISWLVWLWAWQWEKIKTIANMAWHFLIISITQHTANKVSSPQRHQFTSMYIIHVWTLQTASHKDFCTELYEYYTMTCLKKINNKWIIQNKDFIADPGMSIQNTPDENLWYRADVQT